MPRRSRNRRHGSRFTALAVTRTFDTTGRPLLGLAVSRDGRRAAALDDSLRSADEVRAWVDLPVLAVIPRPDRLRFRLPGPLTRRERPTVRAAAPTSDSAVPAAPSRT